MSLLIGKSHFKLFWRFQRFEIDLAQILLWVSSHSTFAQALIEQLSPLLLYRNLLASLKDRLVVILKEPIFKRSFWMHEKTEHVCVCHFWNTQTSNQLSIQSVLLYSAGKSNTHQAREQRILFVPQNLDSPFECGRIVGQGNFWVKAWEVIVCSTKFHI